MEAHRSVFFSKSVFRIFCSFNWVMFSVSLYTSWYFVEIWAFEETSTSPNLYELASSLGRPSPISSVEILGLFKPFLGYIFSGLVCVLLLILNSLSTLSLHFLSLVISCSPWCLPVFQCGMFLPVFQVVFKCLWSLRGPSQVRQKPIFRAAPR